MKQICPECGQDFKAAHHLTRFCCPEHQKRFHSRNAQRGRILLPIAQVSRQGKRGFNEERRYALQQFNALLDRWNKDDREAGRRPDLLVKRKRDSQWASVDLK
jgi:hypothetical protein